MNELSDCFNPLAIQSSKSRKSEFMEENKIVIYQTDDGQTKIDVRLENETLWLTQAQMAILFDKTPQNITMHIRNAYKEGELDMEATCKDFLQVRHAFRQRKRRLIQK